MSSSRHPSGRVSTSHSIPQLPDQLWSCICRFLTEEQVRGMYSVNRSLFRIAMALRYREASVGSLQGVGSEGTGRCLAIAKNVRLRGNVHSLSFTATRLDRDLSDDASGAETAIKKISQLTVVKLVASRWKAKAQSPTSPIAPQFQFRPSSPPPTPTHTAITRTFSLSRRKTREQTVRDQITADLREFLGSLPNLTDLRIHYPDLNGQSAVNDEDNSTIVLLPQYGMETPYAATLTSLTLSGSVTAWKRVIQHHHEWPHLESFKIRVDTGHQNPNDDVYAIRLLLAPFIRRHSKTLKTVSFASTTAQDLTSLYDGIGWLPHLKNLEIQQPYLPPSNNHSEALNQLLFRHRDTLTSFKWSFCASSGTSTKVFVMNPQEWFEQPPYHLTILSLQHLHLAFPEPFNPSFFEGTLFYCARHASTLTHLSLDGLTFTLPQFHELLLLVSSKQLKELAISLEVLTSAVLVNLSTKFPSLKVLRLSFTSVGRQKSISEPTLVDPTAGGILKIPNVSVVKTWQFRHDMAALVLSSWHVVELYLRRNTDRGWREYKLDQVGRLVVKSLPRVGFVNGTYREEYL